MSRQLWTQRELYALRRYYGRAPARHIARYLGRPLALIYAAARRLGLTRPHPHHSRNERFVAFVRQQHALGWTDAELAAAWGCARHCVGHLRRRLGLASNGRSAHYRERMRQRTRAQLARRGVQSLGELRSLVFRERARRAGWPEDLRPRAVQILNALWAHGPLTKRELVARLGMAWHGSSNSLKSGDREGSYLVHLVRRGLVYAFRRKFKVPGTGRGVTFYSLPLWIQRGNVHGEEYAHSA